MKNKSLLLLVFLLTLQISYSQVSKLRLVFKNPQTNSFTLIWSQDAGKNPIVVFADEDFYEKNKKLFRVVKPFKYKKYKGMKTFYAHFDSLKPATTYYFVIKYNNGESQVFNFRTLEENPEKLSVIAGGDSRSNPEVRRNANKIVAKLQPDFVIFDGDFTTFATKKQWQQWLDDWQLTIANGRLIPILPAYGNHESKNDLPVLFNVPQDVYYSFDFGKLLNVTILNSENITPPQTDWLEKTLSKTSAKWKTVTFHKPVRPHTADKSEGDDIYENWCGLFYKYGVNLAIEGDSHVAMITKPIKPDNSPDADEGFAVDEKNGTVYTGEGTWGAPLRPADDKKSWTIDAVSDYQFKWLFIDSTKIEIRTIFFNESADCQSLYYENRFQVPENLKLWKPAGKETIVIKQ